VTHAYCAVVDSSDCECPPGGIGPHPRPRLVTCYACGLDVCRQCSTVIYYAYAKRRCRICFNCQDMRKIGRAALAPNTTRDYMFPAAILKGAIEHDDGTAYLGSLLAYETHRMTAAALGWVALDKTGRPSPTAHGRAVYAEAHLDALPKRRFSRAYAWDWGVVSFKPDHLRRKAG